MTSTMYYAAYTGTPIQPSKEATVYRMLFKTNLRD